MSDELTKAIAEIEIENIVLEGGGVKGLAYGGVLDVMKEYNILPKIKRVAGSSVGAIAAMILMS